MTIVSTPNSSRIILALDVNTVQRASELMDAVVGRIRWVKVGLELITAQLAGEVTENAIRRGFNVFWDQKFKDIPNTVARAVAQLNRIGVWMFNVHCDGGLKMMQAAKQAAEQCERPPHVLGVTVLTSLSYDDLHQIGCVEMRPDAGAGLSQEEKDGVVRRRVSLLTMLAQLYAGLDGVVASPQETKYIREEYGDDFLIVTPAIRPTDAKADDQKRVGTARQAILDGADYLVVGRPIYEAPDPVAAVEALNTEVQQALAEKEKTEQQKGEVIA